MRTDNRISIIMTIKNETKFLHNVLRLLYGGSLPPDDLILVDGWSTDDHMGLYEKLRRKYGFKIVSNADAEGGIKDSPFGAFLKGIPEAKHDYVSLWSVDDDPYPNYLDKMNKTVQEFEPSLITCSADVMRENEMYQRVLYPFDGYVSPECMVKNYKTFGRRINLVGSVIKKSIIEEHAEFLTKVNFDSTYFFHTAFKDGFFNIGQPLILYRSYLNSHGQLGKWPDIKKWIKVSKKKFKQGSGVVFDRANKAGMWDNLYFNWILLQIFPHLPYFLRRQAYKRIYKYDCKEEK